MLKPANQIIDKSIRAMKIELSHRVIPFTIRAAPIVFGAVVMYYLGKADRFLFGETLVFAPVIRNNFFLWLIPPVALLLIVKKLAESKWSQTAPYKAIGTGRSGILGTYLLATVLFLGVYFVPTFMGDFSMPPGNGTTTVYGPAGVK